MSHLLILSAKMLVLAYTENYWGEGIAGIAIPMHVAV
jgi:hypothetical protein